MPFLCMVCFVVFAYCYLQLYQCDVLSQVQYSSSGGETTYKPLIGTIILTTLLVAVSLVADRILVLPLRLRALAWFPAFYLMSAITAPHFSGIWSDTGEAPIWTFVLLPVVYALVLVVCHAYHDLASENRTFASYLQSNGLLMATFCLMTGLLGNSHDGIHYEMKAARLTAEGQTSAALNVARYTGYTSPIMTSVRVEALCREGQLAERLFSYPLPHQTGGVLPDPFDTLRFVRPDRRLYVRLRAIPSRGKAVSDRLFLETLHERDTLPNPAVSNLLIATCLIERDITRFHQVLTERDSLGHLPRHYREAMVLCKHESDIAYDDLFYETQYHRYQQNPSHPEFADTYWRYYFTAE